MARSGLQPLISFLIAGGISLILFVALYSVPDGKAAPGSPIDLKNKRYNAYINEGRDWERKGDLQRAKAAYQEAIRLFPTHKLAKERLLEINRELNSK